MPFVRRNIGKKMKKVAKRIHEIAEERTQLNIHPGMIERRLQDCEWRQTTSIITEPQILGRDEDMEKIVEFILRHACEREELSVYSIVGHGGYGKTTLAQLVFNDERVNTHFDLKIWVCVSDDFSILKILQSIIESKDGKNPNLSSLESMQRKLENGTKGASILVTTRLETVASTVKTVGESPTDDTTIHRLEGLSDDYNLSLFKQLAFGANGEEHAELVKIEAGFSLAELRNLQLRGQLHIRDLQNVSNERDARKANLIGKKDLSCLYLSWGSGGNSQGSSAGAEQVLEALEPHTGLKCFGLKGYEGINIPNWMRNTSILEGLVDVILYNCRNCLRLPPLGKLPYLTTLYVSGMRDVKYIDDDLYEGVTKKAFPSLKKMMLYDLPNLVRVLKAEGIEILSQLSKLHIKACPKLALTSLPSVEILYASGKTVDDGASFLMEIAVSICVAFKSSSPSFTYKFFSTLSIEDFNSFEGVLEALEPHSGLKSFRVKSYGGAHFPPWMMRNTSILKGLVHIILYDCKNCKKLPPLCKLPCLTTLYICGMRDLKYIDDALFEPVTEKAFTSLKKLTLCDLPNLKGVLEVERVEMLPELLNLSISRVPKLALPSFPSVELLSAHGGTDVLLKFISYKNCNEELDSSPRGIVGNNLYNLKSLYISDFAKLKELPDELVTLCLRTSSHSIL
ncbi:hypothetical protein TSUD_289700 [Trifolium subterraneum]|uniref:Uncharacterized protein n=1 Tax=Trifolium subterraneum TaxID=3900 RepID=A0A2Z6N5Y8_TRISU|nr:hypothetical protein TSUD_289700 [Trifolium subterraneum]